MSSPVHFENSLDIPLSEIKTVDWNKLFESFVKLFKQVAEKLLFRFSPLCMSYLKMFCLLHPKRILHSFSIFDYNTEQVLFRC